MEWYDYVGQGSGLLPEHFTVASEHVRLPDSGSPQAQRDHFLASILKSTIHVLNWFGPS